MAGIGLACDVPTWQCAIRACGGAAVVYVVALVCGRIVLSVAVDAMISKSPASQDDQGGAQ